MDGKRVYRQVDYFRLAASFLPVIGSQSAAAPTEEPLPWPETC